MPEPVSSMTPRPVEPRYEAHIGRHGSLKTVLHAEGGTAEIDAPQTGNSAALFAEAGLKLTVIPDSDLFDEDDRKVVLKSYVVDGPTYGRLPVADGTRDPQGQLKIQPATFTVPNDVKGTLNFAFEVTKKDGSTETLWSPAYGASIIPSDKGTIVFGDDWSVSVQGTLRPASQLEIAYDADRLRSLLGLGQDAMPEIAAFVSFDGRPPLRLSVTLEGADGIPMKNHVLLPAVRIPAPCRDVRVWFEGSKDGQHAYDSRFGRDFHFTPSSPLPEADPEWRRAVRILGLENLKEDDYVTLGPPDPAYDCYTFSFGVTTHRVEPPNPGATELLRASLAAGTPVPPWPSNKVDAFLMLYRALGYEVVSPMDASFQPGVEKVALFGVDYDGDGKHTLLHASRMDEEGNWMSKLGLGPLIRHPELRAVAGKSYGEPFLILARPFPLKPA